jgi:GNAT superfamily N-acetyltransferase
MPGLRPVGPEDWRAWRQLRLTALTESPDAFGSRLADWHGAQDREDRWRDRLGSVAFNVMAFEDTVPVGMASGLPTDDSAVELISMYVHRDARGGDVAERLVDAVCDWARGQGATELTLAVRTSNDRARAFYRRCRFEDAGPAEIDPGEPPELLMRRQLPPVIS